MRYLGIDFGRKHVGVAISDQSNSFAFPKDVIANDERIFDILKRIVELEEIAEVVVGDTRAMSGEANQVTEDADAFIKKLEGAVSVPIVRAREAWSTQEAARYAPPGEKHNDSAAAAIILQRFLDARQK